MRYRLDNDAPYAGAIRVRVDADNADLVKDVTDAARHAARCVTWPEGLRRSDAGRTMWQFCRQALRYVLEDGDQLIRMPWRALADGQGDCKTEAVLIASMSAAAGRDTVLRFARYGTDEHFSHVYAVVDGVPCDPRLTFGTEALSSSHLDRRI